MPQVPKSAFTCSNKHRCTGADTPHIGYNFLYTSHVAREIAMYCQVYHSHDTLDILHRPTGMTHVQCVMYTHSTHCHNGQRMMYHLHGPPFSAPLSHPEGPLLFTEHGVTLMSSRKLTKTVHHTMATSLVPWFTSEHYSVFARAITADLDAEDVLFTARSRATSSLKGGWCGSLGLPRLLTLACY